MTTAATPRSCHRATTRTRVDPYSGLYLHFHGSNADPYLIMSSYRGDPFGNFYRTYVGP